MLSPHALVAGHFAANKYHAICRTGHWRVNAAANPIFAALAPLSRRKKYLVGVSGGLDSMVLLHGLGTAGFKNIIVCHLDHGLRPSDAEADRRLVAKAAARFGFPLEFGECDAAAHAACEKVSIEMAARELRLHFFESCASAHRCRRVFLAHHADDQCETILLNLVRGTGMAGLSGMAQESQVGKLVLLRPFLEIPRQTLLSASHAMRVVYREDPSNLSSAHSRNRVRHQVVPGLEKAFGDAWKNGLLRMAKILRVENEWLESHVPDVDTQLDVRFLRDQPLALRRRIAARWLREQGVLSPGFAETERLLGLLEVGTAKINLPRGRHARRRSGKIFLED